MTTATAAAATRTTITVKRNSHSETRKEEHLRFLEQLESLPLNDSCCEICHCDCYNSHRSSELDESQRDDNSTEYFLKLEQEIEQLEAAKADNDNNNNTTNNNNNNNTNNNNSNNNTDNNNSKAHNKTTEATKSKNNTKKTSTKHKQKKKEAANVVSQTTRNIKPSITSKTPEPAKTGTKSKKRSRSASSMHSQQSSASIHNMRDCKILQELLTSLEDSTEQLPRLEVLGHNKQSLSISDMKLSLPSALNNYGTTANANAKNDAKLGGAPIKLCESMANLCLSPSVRQAFHTVPTHDKRILNRMASKRSERVTAKENAWLARKYWENERYERELLKCEEMDEYKKAVRDKQFQDYLQTKARLNEIAQRDLAELQRLRASLQQKDEHTKRRLDAVRTERSIQQCQRRCDELRKCEAVNVQQEEQQLDEAMRKQAICQRLSERLERADQLRGQMLESYLKRVRYDNYLEQLLHEEKWREAQKCELQKREQLKEHISRKRTKSQRFVENRQRRNEALTHTAKISASLRELVRNSVTPEGGGGAVVGGSGATERFTGAVPLTLGRLLLDRPISKLSIQ